jgi:2Fe-2S ferredoxin
MPIIRFLSQNKEIEVPIGTTILQAAKKCGAPEGDACGGVCACSTCHVYVVKGLNLLGEIEDEENDILDKAFDVKSTSRLGCQAKVERDGIIEVEITRESLEQYAVEHPHGLPPGPRGAAATSNLCRAEFEIAQLSCQRGCS